MLLAVAGSALGAPAQNEPPTTAADVPFPDSPFQPDLTPGYALIEGDIQVPLNVFKSLTSGGFQPAALFGGVTYWADNIVPYEFTTSGGGAVSVANQTAAINAMNDIAVRAGVNFRVAVGSDANRIRFQNSSFNNSPIGMQGQVQIINIVNWNIQFKICHEIYHSLGFWHEQSRADRGIYITVNANNICGSGISTACTAGTGPGQCCACVDFAGNCTSCASQFLIRVASTYGPYDFDSIMHYPRAAFSCNGSDTITVNAPWNADWQDAIGQRDHFSYFDAITCRALYPFPGDRWLDRAYDGLGLGRFQQPYTHTSLTDALEDVPIGGTLLIKYGNTYSAIGRYDTAVTIMAPNGAVTLGN